MKYLNNERGTFVLDIFLLLPLFGLLIVWMATRLLYKALGRKKMIIPILSVLTIAGFLFFAGAFYFDYLRYLHSWLSGSLTGNEFMWNYPLNLLGMTIVPVGDIPTYVDFYGFWNMLALFLFAIVYPLTLWLWVQAGYLLFGRSEKQTGVIAFLFPRNHKSPFN